MYGLIHKPAQGHLGPQYAAVAGVCVCRGMFGHVHPAAVMCDMVLHLAFRARRVRKTGIGSEVRHGVTSGISCETSLSRHVTPHLPRES